MATNGAPQPTLYSTAVWDGQEMIAFTGGTGTKRGGRYNPVTDRWAPLSVPGTPQVNSRVASVWNGHEMLLWGGLPPAIGARYNPESDLWNSMTTIGAPKARQSSAVVWTGSVMLVFGGLETSSRTLPNDVLVYSLTKPLYLYRHP